MSEGVTPQGNALELIFQNGAIFLQVSWLILNETVKCNRANWQEAHDRRGESSFSYCN